MMLFTLGGNLVNTLIQNLKNFISNFSSTKDGITFEAETCLNTDLTDLNNQQLLETSNFILTSNNYSETKVVPVIPLPPTNIRNILFRTEGKTTSWSTTQVTAVVATGILDPTGGQNVVRLTEIAATNNHTFFQSIPNYRVQLGGPYTFSTFLRRGDGSNAPNIMQLVFGNGFANFNINTGTVTFSGSVSSANIENAGGGWWRCSIAGGTNGIGVGSINPNAIIAFVNNNPTAVRLPSYSNGANAVNTNVFVYGAQFEKSLSATTYQRNDLYPETTNGFGFYSSSNVSPYWTNSSGLLQNTPYENIIYPSVGISSVANGSTWRWIRSSFSDAVTGFLAPDGTNTASSVQSNNGSRTDYFLTYQTSGNNVLTPSFPIPKIRTLILYVKQISTDRYLGIRLNAGANSFSNNYDNTNTIKIDCSNGTLVNSPTDYPISYSSQSVGDGWYKVCINNTFTWNSMVFLSSTVINAMNNTAGSVLIWGVQVIDGTVDINTPIYNRDLGFSIPRIDYSGSSCPSYLIETGNSNTLLQSENFTSANWIKSNISATTSTFLSPDNNSYSNVLIATGSNGIIRQSGTANSTARQRIFSVYLQRKNGSGPVSISMGSITSTVTLTNSWQRYFVVDPLRTGTYTSTSGNFTVTTSVAHGYQTGDAVFIDFTTGAAADSSISSITVTGPTTFTFILGTSTTSGNCTIYSNTGKILIDTLGDEVYAWGAQIDISLAFTTSSGRVPSSYISTTTVQVSRAGDFFSCNLSGGSIYSLYVELSKIGGANNTANNYIFLGNEGSIGLSRDGIALAGTFGGGIVYSKKENNGAVTQISNPLLYSPIENRSSKILFTISGTTLNLWMDGTLINTNTFAVPSNLRYLIIDGGSTSTVRLSKIATWESTLNTTQAQTLTYNPYFTNGSTELTFTLGRARATSLSVPSDSTLQALDTFILSLKASGTWDKMDAIYNFAYNDSNVATFSRLNLKSTFYSLGTSGTMTYQTNGYLAGASGFLTGYQPGVNNVNFQIDSHSRTYILYQSVNNAQIDSNTVNLTNNAIYNGNVNTHRAMSSNNLPQSVDLSGNGLKTMIRSSFTSVTLYNQSSGTTLNQTRTSGGFGTSQQFFPFTSGLGVGFACFGAPLTQTDINTIRTAYNTYLSAIGLTPFA